MLTSKFDQRNKFRNSLRSHNSLFKHRIIQIIKLRALTDLLNMDFNFYFETQETQYAERMYSHLHYKYISNDVIVASK